MWTTIEQLTALMDIFLTQVIQYGAKLLIPLLHFRARMQHRVGFRNEPTSSVVPALSKLASLISDARMLWRIWGNVLR